MQHLSLYVAGREFSGRKIRFVVAIWTFGAKKGRNNFLKYKFRPFSKYLVWNCCYFYEDLPVRSIFIVFVVHLEVLGRKIGFFLLEIDRKVIEWSVECIGVQKYFSKVIYLENSAKWLKFLTFRPTTEREILSSSQISANVNNKAGIKRTINLFPPIPALKGVNNFFFFLSHDIFLCHLRPAGLKFVNPDLIYIEHPPGSRPKAGKQWLARTIQFLILNYFNCYSNGISCQDTNVLCIQKMFHETIFMSTIKEKEHS